MNNNQLTILGEQNVNGIKFLGMEGGFGQNKKCILVKDIAKIHNKKIKYINKQINNNRKRFKDSIDIIDLKTGSFKELVLKMKRIGIFNQAQIGNAKNIYVLSERGYSKLLKILEDDFAWEQYDKIVDNYFNMRNTIETINQGIDPNMILQLAQGTQLIGQVVQGMQNTISNMQEFVKDSINSKDLQIEKTAEMIGLRDKNTKYFVQTLKEKLSNTLGYKITAKDYVYEKIKLKIFKKFKVIRWEDIPVNKFNEIYVIIDSLEEEDVKFAC